MTSTASRPSDKVRRWWRDLLAAPHNEKTEIFWADVRRKHPRFGEAVMADLRITAANRGERHEFRSRGDAVIQILRLCFVTDAFFAQCCYRVKVELWTRRVPIAPRIFHHLAMVTGHICIGDPVIVKPGVFMPHGMVYVDGMTEIGSGTIIAPYVGIGLVTGEVLGPTIGPGVRIGLGAKVVGPVTIGAGAAIGANAVVLSDIPAGATAVGVPARVRS